MPLPRRNEPSRDNPRPLDAVIIGAGFAGIGLAVGLKRAGVRDFVVIDRGDDVGGVWRDNTYPGAACDVPSHLYSFSFAPNPSWSSVFARQEEILAYLRGVADRFGIRPHLHLGTAVRGATWDEARALWTVDMGGGELEGGETIETRMLVSATGQLSRPLMPRIPGIDTLSIPNFHSGNWDHGVALDGRRVAVVGTGASAIQFVPEIAKRAGSLSVFQRTPVYVIPRPDRPYGERVRALFGRSRLAMALLRLGIYLQLESRAVAFTRFHFLLTPFVGLPAWWLRRTQIADPALRARMTPDFQIGCKRILISNDWFPTFSRPNVELVTDAIERMDGDGIRTADGRVRRFDVVVWGTGFAATDFLAPMRIRGEGGRTLNEAWAEGTGAYLGISVPGFPNFFMLYGPNTNLGHNSIITMLESQIEHVLRARREMGARGATTVEIEESVFAAFHGRVTTRLATSVWAACRSWYVDAEGRNSVNWPGFTWSYAAMARLGALDHYRFRRQAAPGTVTVGAPSSLAERSSEAFLRGFLKGAFRTSMGPALRPAAQRRLADGFALLMPPRLDARRRRGRVGALPVEIVLPPRSTLAQHPGAASAGPARRDAARGAILYLHGGAFVIGNPTLHQALTTRLAAASRLPIWVPDYRLAPEHPFPAALDDALAAWRAMRATGLAASAIAIAGDSAGGWLALALALALRKLGEVPASLALVSPVTDLALGGGSIAARRAVDPMLTEAWLRQGIAAFAGDATPDALPSPLTEDLSGLPPMLVQVGQDEILFDNSVRLADHARACGVDCTLEIHERRWHVFHLQALTLASARSAIRRLGGFARASILAPPQPAGAAAGPVDPAGAAPAPPAPPLQTGSVSSA